jgi:hypothetical protein
MFPCAKLIMKSIFGKHYSKAPSTSKESLNKCITKYKLPISMQFKECVFANLQLTSMEYGAYEICHG